eukprot:gene7282-biopygen6
MTVLVICLTPAVTLERCGEGRYGTGYGIPCNTDLDLHATRSIQFVPPSAVTRAIGFTWRAWSAAAVSRAIVFASMVWNAMYCVVAGWVSLQCCVGCGLRFAGRTTGTDPCPLQIYTATVGQPWQEVILSPHSLTSSRRPLLRHGAVVVCNFGTPGCIGLINVAAERYSSSSPN